MKAMTYNIIIASFLKDDFSVFFTSELNAGYVTLAYLKHISGTISTQSSLFT